MESAEISGDGYIVNAIIDAAYKSAESKKWEPVKLLIWRGKENIATDTVQEAYDEHCYLIKKETTYYGTTKLILKDKKSGEIVKRAEQ